MLGRVVPSDLRSIFVRKFYWHAVPQPMVALHLECVIGCFSVLLG